MAYVEEVARRTTNPGGSAFSTRPRFAYDWLIMRFPPLRSLALAALLASVGGAALADCSDVAQPGVQWRRCVLDGQDLREANLTGANLRDASFKRADLSNADLTEADGRRTKFISANMKDTVLDRANLVRADFTNADMVGASLKNADLTSAKMFRTDLTGADLTGARLNSTDLLHAVLDNAIWVDGVTICAEGSIGQCHPGRKRPDEVSEAEPRS
jgi:uncharacterized protein YjbI with pentapeptide repeats